MQDEPAAECFIVAVSGGVDSVVLLDILVRQSVDGQRLVVAHFDHGIRADSADDRRFVAGLAAVYGLPFAYEEGALGAGASEAMARQARYGFLRRLRQEHQARSIILAHHQDDVLETAILNLLRGTGRRGLSSLRTTDELYRPLLTTPKQHIVRYAERQGLQWREDSTNHDTAYLRNYIRHQLLPRFDDSARMRLVDLLQQAGQTNSRLDGALDDLLLANARHLHQEPVQGLAAEPAALPRQWFIMLPYAVSREVLATWLRQAGIRSFDRRGLERITVAAKTYAVGKQIDIDGQWQVAVERQVLRLRRR